MCQKLFDVLLGVLVFLNFVAVSTSYTLKDLEDDIEIAAELVKGLPREQKRQLGDKLNILSTGDIPESFKCPKIPRPQFGSMTCGGSLCYVDCEEGYMQDLDHAFVYKCNDNGQWSTIPDDKPIPWPGCIKERFDLYKERLAAQQKYLASQNQ